MARAPASSATVGVTAPLTARFAWPSWAALLTALLGAAVLALLSAPAVAASMRVMEVAQVQGIRSNQLTGYGLVVGLDGTGDQATQTPFTTQSLNSMLQQFGIVVPPGTSIQPKNVAAVIVTATLEPSAQPGKTMDIVVSSVGNSKSLRGGTLIATPLRGADNQVYAMAQGNLIVGGAGASSGGSKVQINHLSAGRIPNGATVERAVPAAVGEAGQVMLSLNDNDFALARAVARSINKAKGANTARAMDGRNVAVKAPDDPSDRTDFLADVLNLPVELSRPAARVVLNPRTGSVVMNDAVTLGPCAVAHGNLSVTINSTPVISQPNPLAGGQTVQAQKSDISVNQQGGALVQMKEGAQLADVVKALNALGATPGDLLVILQAMKAAGALRAELEVL